MSPYINLKTESCLGKDCENDARIKVVTLPNGVVIPLCLDCAIKVIADME